MGGIVTTASVLPAPTSEWVKEVFENLVRRRLVVKVRHSYTTVHRDWARALICYTLGDSRTQDAVSVLLERDFDTKNSNPKRLMILWSWLLHDRNGSKFVENWVNRQKAEDWKTLVGMCANAGLVELGMIASRLHILHNYENWKTIVGEAFEAHESAITKLVISANAEHWYYLRELFMALNYACPKCAARIISCWSPATVANVLHNTHPDYYGSILWFISGVRDHSSYWCNEIGNNLDWKTFSEKLNEVRNGGLWSIIDMTKIFRYLGFPVMRSMVGRFAEAMANTLKDAPLVDIRYDVTTFSNWLEVFPQELKKVAKGLDAKRLAAELSAASPKHWRNIFTLSQLACRAKTDFAKDLIDALDEEKLLPIVEKHCTTCQFEFRILLWQISLGTPERRTQLAECLFPFVRSATETTNDHERESLLKAYANISKDKAEDLVKEMGWILPDYKIEYSLDKSILEFQPKYKKVRKHLDALDLKGEDYDVIDVVSKIDV